MTSDKTSYDHGRVAAQAGDMAGAIAHYSDALRQTPTDGAVTFAYALAARIGRPSRTVQRKLMGLVGNDCDIAEGPVSVQLLRD